MTIIFFSSLVSAYYETYTFKDSLCEYNSQNIMESCILDVKTCTKYADENAKSFDEYLWKNDLCRMSYTRCKREAAIKNDLCRDHLYYKLKTYHKYQQVTYHPIYSEIHHPYKKNCRILYLLDEKNSYCRGISLCYSYTDIRVFETFTECQEALLGINP